MMAAVAHHQDVIEKEIQALENEFEWVLNKEVPQVMLDLQMILQECLSKFPGVLADSHPARGEAETFILSTPSTTPSDQVRVVVTFSGQAITHADINLKLPKSSASGSGVASVAGSVASSSSKDLYFNTAVRDDAPWALQQVQDAGNHLKMAVQQVSHLVDQIQMIKCGQLTTPMHSAPDVLVFLAKIMSSISKSRSVLANPKKRTLEELRSSKFAKALFPPLPAELAVSFYLQNGKLVFAVYQVATDPKTGAAKFNRYQSDCVIAWMNEVLLLLTIALQKCQQLADKINVFSQYNDFPSQCPATAP